MLSRKNSVSSAAHAAVSCRRRSGTNRSGVAREQHADARQTRQAYRRRRLQVIALLPIVGRRFRRRHLSMSAGRAVLTTAPYKEPVHSEAATPF